MGERSFCERGDESSGHKTEFTDRLNNYKPCQFLASSLSFCNPQKVLVTEFEHFSKTYCLTKFQNPNPSGARVGVTYEARIAAILSLAVTGN